MSVTLNPFTGQLQLTSGNGGGGVPVYPNSGSFPASPPNGTLAVDGSTHIVYEYNSTAVAWQPIASNAAYSAALSDGTVQSVSVVSANGFAGAVANPTTTPAITLSTTVSGILKGNGSSISAAVSGTDYQPPGNYITALTGDGTASGPGSSVLTLSTVNSNTGTFGSASSVGTFTVNGKGLLTAAGSTAIQIAESQVTNLVSDLAGKQPSGNYITALTGDATASGPGSAAITLASVTTAGTATKVTYNAKGLITSGTTLSSSDIPNLSATYVTQTEVGAASGVAPLDASSKIPSAYLPSTVLQYEGLWNPSTNTPALSDLTGTGGYVYQVSVAYAGPVVGLSNSTMVNFQVGNLVIYSPSLNQWEQTTPAAGVSSVNGAQGAVTVNAINQLTGDVAAGPASGSASAVATIQSNVVSNSKLAQMAANTIKGNNTAGTANAADLTGTQVTALLTPFVGDTGSGGTQGIVPAPPSASKASGDFLSASGSWLYVDQSSPLYNPFSFIGITQWTGSTAAKFENLATYTGIDGHKQYAAIVAGGLVGTLFIWDITDPQIPVLCSYVTLAGAYNVSIAQISGAIYAFVPSSGSSVLYTINVTNPYSLTTTSSLTITNSPGSLYSCVYSSGYVYIATQNKGLTVVDVGGGLAGGTITAPVQSYQEGGTTNKTAGVAISGNIVYTTNYQTTFPATVRYLKTWQLAAGGGTLAVPNLANTYTISGGPTGTSTKPLGIAVNAAGTVAYVTDGNQGIIDIISVSTPTSPSYLTYITPSYTLVDNSLETVVTTAAIVGNYIYVPSGSNATNGGCVDLFDVTTPSAPIKLNSIYTSSPNDVFGGIALNSGYIFGADYGSTGNYSGIAVFTQAQLAPTFGLPITSNIQVEQLTANTALVSNSSLQLASSTTTATELGYVHGVTSAIQTQLNGITSSAITALTGQVTASGPGSAAATIATNTVTNSNLAQMAAHTYKGNNTASTANAIDVTNTQLTADLNQFTSSLQGVVPGSGGGSTNFLRADGTWAVPSGTGSVTTVSVVSANGFAGTVANASSTPAITLSTSITGLLKGNGTAISAAVSGTDYQPAGNYITALTGDATAAGPGSTALTLATVNSNVGSFTNASVTVNAKGLVTAASSGPTPVLASTGDINETTFTAADNQASPINVTGLAFANGSVTAFQAIVSVVRNATYAFYTLDGIQKASLWEMSQSSVGDVTGITFSITTSGQIQYTTTSTGFTAALKFRAFTL